MLTEQQKALVKDTVPVLKANGVALTTYFYNRMLTKNPELRNVFNQANQHTGAQPTALAMAVLAYAEHIDDPSVLMHAVQRIGNKHVSLDVRPEQYAIVGRHLLASIQEVLGAAATPELIEAWTIAYNNLAKLMAGVEADMYAASAAENGGWSGWRPFIIKQKVKESDEITSFYLHPADGGAVAVFSPGQYLTVRLFVPELNIFQPRQYSISCAPNGSYYRISVKKEHGSLERPTGYVSNLLHEEIREGAVIEVGAPSGSFVLKPHDSNPVVFISGGVGITPFMSMLDDMIAREVKRPVTWIHGCRGYEVHAFRDQVLDMKTRSGAMTVHTFYDKLEGDVDANMYDGYVDLCRIEDAIVADADYYICGPTVFIKKHVHYLRSQGVNARQIHFEEFGPAILEVD